MGKLRCLPHSDHRGARCAPVTLRSLLWRNLRQSPPLRDDASIVPYKSGFVCCGFVMRSAAKFLCGGVRAPRPTKFYRWPVRRAACPQAAAYNDSFPTVDAHERQWRKMKGDSSHITKTAVFCERAVQDREFVIGTSCRKSRNLGFWLFFWSLLEQRPKVTRARRHGIFQNGRTELSAPTTV